MSAHVYTGLLGPDEFRVALRHAVASGRPGESLALVLVHAGPAPEPRLITVAARTLRSAAKGVGIAGHVDENRLALLLPGASAEDASRVAARTREAVEKAGLGAISIGVAEWRGDPDCAEQLLSAAAAAVGDAFAGRPHEAGRAAETMHAAQLAATYLATVKTLAAAVEAKDGYTGGHIHRVQELGLLLANEVIPEDASDPQFAYGCLLHDVGKLSIPDAILTKPGGLTGDEWELMRGHPREGARILAGIPFLGRALHIVLYHHERWDGLGYPHGLRGNDIPRWARVFAVVDTVDAMTSRRPYRPALPLEHAVEELRKEAGRQFDPDCVAAFERLDRDAVDCIVRRHAVRPAP